MKNKIAVIILIMLIPIVIMNFDGVLVRASADDLTDNINEQIEKIDFSELEEFLNSMNLSNDFNFFSLFNEIVRGEYKIDFNLFLRVVFNSFFDKVYETLPTVLGVIVVSILCGIIQNCRGEKLSDGVKEVTFFASFSAVAILVLTVLLPLWKNTQIIIQNIAKLTQIMLPIILTLMIAVGGNVSASVYSPTVGFLSNGIINVILSVVIPIVGIMIIFSVVSNLLPNFKLNKFSDFFAGILKWVLGIIITVFTVFLSVQGITSASFDGISFKAAKYAISNSIPIIGGFIKDGFDLVVAGSVIIKNSIGATSVFVLFGIVLSPILNLIAVSTLLKLSSAIIEPISDQRISSFCFSISKCINYLIASILAVGLMFFITVLLMTISANAFI